MALCPSPSVHSPRSVVMSTRSVTTASCASLTTILSRRTVGADTFCADACQLCLLSLHAEQRQVSLPVQAWSLCCWIPSTGCTPSLPTSPPSCFTTGACNQVSHSRGLSVHPLLTHPFTAHPSMYLLNLLVFWFVCWFVPLFSHPCSLRPSLSLPAFACLRT